MALSETHIWTQTRQ